MPDREEGNHEDDEEVTVCPTNCSDLSVLSDSLVKDTPVKDSPVTCRPVPNCCPPATDDALPDEDCFCSCVTPGASKDQ